MSQSESGSRWRAGQVLLLTGNRPEHRAILETFYSTGVRRSELAHLRIDDIDSERRTMMIRQGKGKKDRVIPIGRSAALSWLEVYLRIGSSARTALQSLLQPALFR